MIFLKRQNFKKKAVKC